MQPNDHKPDYNLFLAIGLSLLVLFGWQMFYADPKIKEERARIEAQKQQQSGGTPAGTPSATQPIGVPQPSGQTPGGSGIAPAKVLPRSEALALSPRIAVETPSLKGSIALKGGRFDDLSLIKYRETSKRDSPIVTLLSPSNSENPYFAEYGFVPAPGTSQKTPDSETVWALEKEGTLTPTTPVTLTWDNGQGLAFRRTISVDEDYMFKVVDEVENRTSAEVALLPYARVHRFGMPKLQGFYILHEGLIGVNGEAGLQEITYTGGLKEPPKVIEKVTGGWLGITDKYWAAALIPDQKEQYRATYTAIPASGAGDKDSFQSDYLRSAVTIPAGARKGVEGHLYAGAKQVSAIDKYEQKLGIQQFDLMVDWGWFYFLTKPLFSLMEWLNGFFKNFGVTILAVTVLVKLAFFPLANKSYEAMAKMKKLQPEMERIKERFKDDTPRQQKELMELYKKEKVNPAAGCLPVLLQIPVFFALYKVLFVTIDMRHAPFFGWVQDLSAADPTSIFNLFGLLPYAVPEWLHIGVWPLLMGITMWIQMQLSPPPTDPVQQTMFAWMPPIFTFLLASFPAGLVIYWAWSNILSILQQWYIMKKNGAEVHLLQNLKRQLGPLGRLFGAKQDAKSKS